MSDLSLKPFVSSAVCLKCDGCCRYKQSDSIWRPKLGKSDQQNLGITMTAGDALDKQGYVKTIQACGNHLCRFLNSKDNTCGVYNQRPFECALYPFILSQTKETIKVYVHLSCPYVQDNQPSVYFDDYVNYLKTYFNQQDVREFLINNAAMLHDYTPHTLEFLYLFDLP